ncbi:MAG: T9SS type A sorting domain-containing protein [Salibacteraceae bacterium]
MKKHIQKFGLLITTIFFYQLGVAAPNWSVNSANYSLDFSVIATLNYNGVNSISTNDILGAFDSQGNIRGVANVSYNNLAGVYVASMTVLGNTPGDSIFFKIYNANDDSIVNARNPAIIFQPNILVGNIIDPYIISNINIPLAVHLVAPIFSDSVPINTFVGKFTISAFDSLNTSPDYFFTDSVGNSDSIYFLIRDDSLFTNVVFDADNDSVFYIKVTAIELGVKVYNTFKISVFKHRYSNVYELHLNAPNFADSVAIGTYVGKFSMSGFDTNIYTPTYAFTDTIGNADSSFFYIQNDSLFTNKLFNYDSNYIFFLKIDGKVLGQTIGKTFQVRVLNSTPNGINNLELEDFKLYPNPASNYVQLELNQLGFDEIEIRIYNASGQLVKNIQKYNSPYIRIETSEFQQGMYWVEIITPLSRNAKQLIIK